ncbi:GDP-mannose 4,6-dehydratase [Arenicella xantha]|uniref:GDP-mannose 4,6-dehydratase n=1 Tax=Arenicella xantha TaxID=644221 RepID=A0A395JR49_9GAMM|nr:GDP-mannose 4,6-dehydratase [Arenicella xantha]RBP52802.1 GDPmannose 4,6-dehydratase [Arenicella xantha]
MNALIFGVTGQDGAYLARFLLAKGYTVFGTSRDSVGNIRTNPNALGIDQDIRYMTVDITDYKSVLTALNTAQPDEIYNLAGQSSVGISYELPFETIRSFTLGVLNVMEGVRFLDLNSRIFNASSGECFGETGDTLATEQTKFAPKSPYAVAKASAYWSVINYRQAYGLHACSGILFSHESILRNPNFVSKKIVAAACRIAKGQQESLTLGNLEIKRDWGWASEFVEAMWLMLQQKDSIDYVIATGHAYTLEDFVRLSFEVVGLDYRDHLHVSDQFVRPNDVRCSAGSPALIEKDLGWKAKSTLPDVVAKMVESEQSTN